MTITIFELFFYGSISTVLILSGYFVAYCKYSTKLEQKESVIRSLLSKI